MFPTALVFVTPECKIASDSKLISSVVFATRLHVSTRFADLSLSLMLLFLMKLSRSVCFSWHPCVTLDAV